MKFKEVTNNFNHLKIETELYKDWTKKKLFNSNPSSTKKKFSILMPPPNVTGTLHIGHALNMTLQDILTRYWRMNDRDVLWQPGTDHAGIATQSIVEKQLLNKNKTTKDKIGKEKFLSETWKWKEESGKKIIDQIKRLGASPDWDRIKFTLDSDMSKAVNYAFSNLHDKGFIYKDKRLINWDINLQTAISDLEVEQKEQKGYFVFIKYQIVDSSEHIVVATTRPETLFGDCCIAVNPTDKRYKKFVGKNVIIPLTNNRIPILEDVFVDKEKGTGALKVTPAHDFNDYKIGKKYNFKSKIIFDKRGRFNFNVPKKYQGKDRLDCRNEIINDLKLEGYIKKIENIEHSIPYGDRSGTVIEPYLTDQWFLNVKDLAQKAIGLVKDNKTIFYPKNWTKTFYVWMNEIEPWCISRQIWWGHQIPAWYGPAKKVFVGKDIKVVKEKAKAFYGKDVKLIQETDVLDTWFSSSLWPLSTLGWPEDSDYIKKYFPTDVLITGFDIIFFWVARMMIQSSYFKNSPPFKSVYIHALVRDKSGKKMSKSKGNVIDPLELIDKYGADPLRFTLSSMAAQGRDIKLSEDMVKINRNFNTKIWNSYKFLEKNDCLKDNSINLSEINEDLNVWIINELNYFIKNINDSIKNYRFNDASKEIYKFVKNIFCDWYLEISKIIFQNGHKEKNIKEIKEFSCFIFQTILKLAHPFMPFITDHLYYEKLSKRKYLIQEKWPKTFDFDKRTKPINDIEYIISLVSKIRNIKSNLKVEPKKILNLHADRNFSSFKKTEDFYETINKLAKVKFFEYKINYNQQNDSFKFVFMGNTFYLEIPTDEFLNDNAKKDIKLLKNELKKIDSEISRLNSKINNKNFISKAPSEIVEETRKKLKKNIKLREKLLLEI